MKKIIILTILLVNLTAQAAAEVSESEIEEFVKIQPTSSAVVPAQGTTSKETALANTPEAEKKADAPKSTGFISSPTTALLAGSALDLTKTLLVGPSAKSDGGTAKSSSTWTGNVGFDIQNQGLDQTSLGNIGTDITNIGGGTTQIQFAGGGNTGAQQVNKKK